MAIGGRKTTTATAVRKGDALTRAHQRAAVRKALAQAGIDSRGRPLPASKRAMPSRRPGAPATGRTRYRKPKGFASWLGIKGSKALEKIPGGRAVRGLYRFGSREAAGWRDRKQARKANRDPNIPTRRSVFRSRMADKRQRLTGASTECLGCNQTLTRSEAATHQCGGPGSGPAPQPFAKAQAQLQQINGGHGGRDPTRHDQRRQRRKAWKADRKESMSLPSRVWDTTKRQAARTVDLAGVCNECGVTLWPDEMAGHRCWETTPAQPGSTPASAGPIPTAASGGAVPQSGPTVGSAAPKGAPAMAAGNGGAPSGGTGTASAAGIVAAWSAWSQEHPQFHVEMVAKMNASRQAVAQSAHHIEQFMAWMVAPRENGGGGFHPACAQPLSGAANRMAEAANAFTDTLMQIERVYAPVLAHYRSGTPDPGAKYMSDGRVANG